VDLATFGAILSFAMEFEEKAADFYGAAAKGTLKEAFNDLERSSKKRASRMERTRREGVAEMILESITGLNGDNYGVELTIESLEPELLQQAIALEETAQRFYTDAASKIPIREVVRIFQRMADENEKRKEQLKSLAL
jgi:rubrerythrin